MSNEDAWPALGAETQQWRAVQGWGLRATEGAASVSYESAVPPLIADREPRVDSRTAVLANDAATELSRFDSELGSRVTSFGPLLLRSEAASSSQIENLTASARAILSAELGAKRSSNAGQIVSNTRAMDAALDLADDITEDRIRQMHAILMEHDAHHTPGSWRSEPVWIGRRGDSPVGAEFVAPHHDRVPELINDLVHFARRFEVAPLVATAVAHAQFETIHPFTDGNGRTGRALAQSMLRYRGVTRNVAVPVSAGLLANVRGYHEALTSYRAGDIEPIVDALSIAALRAVENARTLVANIDDVVEGWNDKLTVRRSSNAWRLLDLVSRRPVLTTQLVAEFLQTAPSNAYRPLRALEEAGILTSKAEHGLGPFWRSDEILAALDRFAQRAGRRTND